MNIKNEENNGAGSFYTEENNKRIGELKYSIDNSVMNIYHTEVDPKLQGRSIGFKLVEAAVKYAREKQLKVTPTCNFAKLVFERFNGMDDVLV